MMTKTLLPVGGILFALCLATNAMAQSPVALATREAKLQELAERLEQRGRQDRQAVQAYAQRLGIPMRRELPDGRILELQRLIPNQLLGQRPVFYITNNVDAADTVSTDEVWPGGAAGLDLDGGGMTMAQWDGGAVMPDHPEFAGRLTQVDGVTTVSGHSTHVAGTLISAGNWLLPESRGMAYAGQLDAYDWNTDTAEMAAAAAAGQLVSNHSYGIAAGWLYIGEAPPDQWWWIGGADPSDVEDPHFGYYDAESQLWDQIAYDAPFYLPVKAAGNDRNEIGPAPGEEYTVIDQEGTFLFTSTLPRNPDCAPAGYDCLPTHSVAKNILTVGAVDDILGGYSPLSGPASVVMADFSSWGPTDDGRIKPDLVGNGIFLYSTWPEYPYYALAAGTSMAAPNVSGSLLLLQQHWQDLHGPGNFMRASTLKALAIHTADEAGAAPGPDYAFGWGLLNTRTAAEVISEDGLDHEIIEAALVQGATDTYAVSVADADATVTATLVWTDPPGTPVPLTLDPPDLMLVNDLDLRVSRGGSTWYPWVLNPASPSAAATTGDNFRDNVEQVEVTGATNGNYTVAVSHKGALLNGSAQDYSLVISVDPPPPTGSGFLIDEDFSGGMPPGWTIETIQGIAWAIKTPVPGHSRLDNLTGGSGPFAMVDNAWVNYTITSLRTPVLDLSANDAAILRFKSYFYFDLLETINVETSTDAGASWTSVWQWSGFALPSTISLDLSGRIAGHSNVMIRFRYDSQGDNQGNLWQVDDIELEVFGGGEPPPGDPPGPAGDPSPANGAAGQGVDTNLAWSPGSLAASHDVYFGTGNPLTGGDFQGNQTGTSFDPGPLAYATTYFWRVDEVNDDGTTTGATWSFTTEVEPLNLPGPASNPSPANGAADLDTDTDLTWTAGSLATSHDLYFGTSTPFGAGDFQGNLAGTTFDPGPLTDGTTYFWRVDAVNADGTTTGSTWSFSTAAAPTETMHLAGMSGSAIPEPRGRWAASVTIAVAGQAGGPEAGVTVEGGWSGGANGSGTCVTDAQGGCAVERGNLKQNAGNVTFTVTNLVKAGLAYEPGDNVGGDSIVVGPDDVDQTPAAVDDSYQTDVDVTLNGNVMDNDDPGDGPATVDSNTLPASGSLSLAADGAFSYTPNPGFEGNDSFGYRIVDQDGDLSNTATVTISVSSGEPPPPPPEEPTLTATPFKDKGVQHVQLDWLNLVGGTVEIRRDGVLLTGAALPNTGSYVDNIGAKGGGVTYGYEVCETGTAVCASANASF